MKTFVVTQITINARAADVFTYLTNLKYHHLWNPQVQSISTTKQLRTGDTYRTTSLVLGIKISATNVVTKLVEPKELEIENGTGLVKYCANFKLQPNDKQTLLICTTTVSADSDAFAFAKPVLKLLARRELQADMQCLKIAVENRLK